MNESYRVRTPHSRPVKAGGPLCDRAAARSRLPHLTAVETKTCLGLSHAVGEARAPAARPERSRGGSRGLNHQDVVSRVARCPLCDRAAARSRLPHLTAVETKTCLGLSHAVGEARAPAARPERSRGGSRGLNHQDVVSRVARCPLCDRAAARSRLPHLTAVETKTCLGLSHAVGEARAPAARPERSRGGSRGLNHQDVVSRVARCPLCDRAAARSRLPHLTAVETKTCLGLSHAVGEARAPAARPERSGGGYSAAGR